MTYWQCPSSCRGSATASTSLLQTKGKDLDAGPAPGMAVGSVYEPTNPSSGITLGGWNMRPARSALRPNRNGGAGHGWPHAHTSAARPMASGRAGGGCRQSRRCSGPSWVRADGEVAELEQPPVQVHEPAYEAAAIHGDGPPDFVPECPVEMAGRDTEIEADIDDDRADRPAAHLGGDFLFRGQACETRVLGVVGGLKFGLSVRRRGLPCRARPTRSGQADGRRREVPAACGALAQLGFQGRGATQTSGDASEDDREIGGAEGFGEVVKARGGGALLHSGDELFPVVDQFADQADDAAESGRHAGARRIGAVLDGRGWGGGRVGHEWKESTRQEGCQGKYSITDTSRVWCSPTGSMTD